QEAEGVDTSINYRFETETIGSFNFTVNAAHLSKFVQTPDPISAEVLAAQATGDPAVPIDITVVGAGDLLRMNGNPEWRGYGALHWSYGPRCAGVRYNYVSDFYESSITPDEGFNMTIPSCDTVDLYADYEFGPGAL